MPGFIGGSSGGSSGGAGGEITFPKEFVDPVTKLRVSNPQNLIDTDFEYGLQPTKWETVELINNTPSFFSKSGDTTIPGIISITTNAGTREITVRTALEHGLAIGIPINVTGTKSVTADGSYIINSIPNETTFTYLSRDNETGNNSIEDLYTSIITGEFFQGSQLRISDAEGIVTDGEPISTLTVTTESTHGFGTSTPFYFLNLNSTISQEFQAANTAAKSFDSSNSATAQTFDGSNALTQIPIDYSNSATSGGTSSAITSVDTATNTITVTHTSESFVDQPLGTPLYHNVTTSAGYFSSNPLGVVFLNSVSNLGAGSSTFTVSTLPDGDDINLEAAMAGTFQLANQARTFAGNNINAQTEFTLAVEDGDTKTFDGGNENGAVAVVNSYASGGIVNATNSEGSEAPFNWVVGQMVLFETTGSAPSGLLDNVTYWVRSVNVLAAAAPGLINFTVSATPTGAAISSITGGTGDMTFTAIGVSVDKDTVHVPNHGYTLGDMIRYEYPVGGEFTAGGDTADYYYVETVYDDFNFTLSRVKGGVVPLDGSTEALAAPSAIYLRDTIGITTSGNYWIKPENYSGAARLLWCDMTNQGGGWVLIGKGRADSNNNSGWFGTNNELNVAGLQQANSRLGGVSKVSSSFVNYLMNGTANGWDNSRADNFMVANRINNAQDGRGGTGDSAYMKVTNQTTWAWVNQFGASQTDRSGDSSGRGAMTAWTGTWLSGSTRPGAFTNGNFIDNDFGSGNGTGRWFMWHWSGHGSWHGWSSGSTERRGFQNGSEGHALQFVQLWAR